MLDTKGPEIRTALNKAGRDVKVQLKEGQKFTFFYEDRLGDEEGTSLSYKDLYKDVKPGNLILIDDGKIQIRVDEIKDKDIIGTVLMMVVLVQEKYKCTRGFYKNTILKP